MRQSEGEAERQKRSEEYRKENKVSGGNSWRAPPVPIPNTEVKPPYADGTWLETARESRSSPDSNMERRVLSPLFILLWKTKEFFDLYKDAQKQLA